MEEADPRKPHHHGDLRAALVAAGLALLEEGGPEALTLRKAAARAGVSHAAPAHHFANLAGLRQAIAAEGFRLFRDSMVRARAAGENTPRGRLRAICRGYLDFARANRALFLLMFGFGPTEAAPRGAGGEAYDVLREGCAPFQPRGADPAVLEAQVWALIHGFTSLHLAGYFRPAAGNEADLFDPVMALLDRVGTAP